MGLRQLSIGPGKSLLHFDRQEMFCLNQNNLLFVWFKCRYLLASFHLIEPNYNILLTDRSHEMSAAVNEAQMYQATSCIRSYKSFQLKVAEIEAVLFVRKSHVTF